MQNKNMSSLIAYCVILKLVLVYGQFEKNTCVGDVEIAFSILSRSFNGARSSCQSFGGDLLKISSSAIQDKIENTVIVDPAYYIGAYDNNGDNVYHWLVDSTEVPNNPYLGFGGNSTGYQKWKPNQPNDVAEKCVVLGVHGIYSWSDQSCGIRSRYICQRELLSLTTTTKSATCQSTLSSVGVRWERNSVIVDTTDNGGVYQTNGTNSATLNFENAKSAEAGDYTCATKNYKCYAQKNYSVKRTLIINQISSATCNSSLFVTWSPGPSINSSYRIVALNSSMTPIYQQATMETQETQIPGLSSLTKYTIEVTPCKRLSGRYSCNSDLRKRSAGVTDGVTDAVSSATMGTNKDSLCLLSWGPSTEATGYTVTYQCNLRMSRSKTNASLSKKRVSTTAASFPLLPNRKCEAFIEAEGCGEISKKVKAIGVCEFAANVPSSITRPTLLEDKGDNSQTIVINKPDETNGLISCVFIIICYGNFSKSEFNLHRLMMANQNNQNSDRKLFVVAAAIPISKFSDGLYSHKLFSEGSTSCNVYNNELSNSSLFSNGTIHARNARGNFSGLFTVTTTPLADKVLLKSSPTFYVIERGNCKFSVVPQNRTTTCNQETEHKWIVGIAVSGLTGIIIGLIFGVALSRYVYKQKLLEMENAEDIRITHESKFPHMVQSNQSRAGSFSDPGYEEVGPRRADEDAAMYLTFDRASYFYEH